MRKLTVLKCSLALVAVLCGCQLKSHSVHKVLIAYPEHWDEGDRKSCFLGPPGGSTVRKVSGQPNLPELDCDRVVEGEDLHATPPERILVRDVAFSEGDFSKQLESSATTMINEAPVTCQLTGKSIACTP